MLGNSSSPPADGPFERALTNILKHPDKYPDRHMKRGQEDLPQGVIRLNISDIVDRYLNIIASDYQNIVHAIEVIAGSAGYRAHAAGRADTCTITHFKVGPIDSSTETLHMYIV